MIFHQDQGAFTLSQTELNLLNKMRQQFIEIPAQGIADYWRSKSDLELYDKTFARRIRWKWDAVLSQCSAIALHEYSKIIDWGCGSGAASEALLDAFPTLVKYDWFFVDGSNASVDYCRNKFGFGQGSTSAFEAENSLVLISHVLTELTPCNLQVLLSQTERAAAIIWVEPGNIFCSRKLVEIRELLKKHFAIIAPCTHAEKCPLNSTDWCHVFARSPSWIFQSSSWSMFANKVGIDLHRLPVSYLVLSKIAKNENKESMRLIGELRKYKGYGRALFCADSGHLNVTLSNKSEKILISQIENSAFGYLLEKNYNDKT